MEEHEVMNQNSQDLLAPQSEPESKGFAVASMVLGIVSIVFVCCLGWFVLIPAGVSLILGIVSLVKHKPGKGMAIAGIVCAAVAIILLVTLVIVGIVLENDPEFQNLVQQMVESMQQE
ncbi:MAG: DUF4190 domain-containing protein [Lachnospiraceae bacterium]|nr:DUF4190 domain-containing protein [Lachnospiraceae bacterium]MDD3615057.1 DUF4190 domain-containing protein [Lachnospiraceae bacterium]